MSKVISYKDALPVITDDMVRAAFDSLESNGVHFQHGNRDEIIKDAFLAMYISLILSARNERLLRISDARNLILDRIFPDT